MDNVTELKTGKPEMKEGSVVTIKSGGPAMVIASVRTIFNCEYYDDEARAFMNFDFLEHEIEPVKIKK